MSSFETKEGNIRFNRNGSSTFSAQEWVQTIKMLAGKTETREVPDMSLSAELQERVLLAAVY